MNKAGAISQGLSWLLRRWSLVRRELSVRLTPFYNDIPTSAQLELSMIAAALAYCGLDASLSSGET
jgi:hypothetical protein